MSSISPDPFFPTQEELIDVKLDLAQIQPGEVVCDLGCGDGRVLFRAIERFDCKVVGVEIRKQLVEQARRKADELNASDRVQFICGEFADADVSAVDVLILYLSRGNLGQISLKLEQELKPGARIVTHGFDLPAWTADTEQQFLLADRSTVPVFVYKVA